MRRQSPPVCDGCENSDDLAFVGGETLCRECRTCPHGAVYHVDGAVPGVCLTCVVLAFSVETVYGPMFDGKDTCREYLIAQNMCFEERFSADSDGCLEGEEWTSVVLTKDMLARRRDWSNPLYSRDILPYRIPHRLRLGRTEAAPWGWLPTGGK